MPADLRERIAADIRAAGVAVRTSTPAEFAAAIAQAVGIRPTQ